MDRFIPNESSRCYSFFEKSSDFKIYCQDKIFPCHQFTLYKGSKYFEALFLSGLKEAQEGKLEIQDAKAEDVEKLLHFIYEKEINEDEASCDLYILADRFDVPELKTLIIKHLFARVEEDDLELYNTLPFILGEERNPCLKKAYNLLRIWKRKNRGYYEKAKKRFPKDVLREMINHTRITMPMKHLIIALYETFKRSDQDLDLLANLKKMFCNLECTTYEFKFTLEPSRQELKEAIAQIQFIPFDAIKQFRYLLKSSRTSEGHRDFFLIELGVVAFKSGLNLVFDKIIQFLMERLYEENFPGISKLLKKLTPNDNPSTEDKERIIESFLKNTELADKVGGVLRRVWSMYEDSPNRFYENDGFKMLHENLH